MPLVLFEIVDRSTNKPLTATVEKELSTRQYETEYMFLDRVKTEYLLGIMEDIKYIPSMRRLLEGKNWFVTAVVMDFVL